MKGRTSRAAASELRSHIGYHLRVVSNAVSQAFARELSASDVTVAEWVILREMYSGRYDTTPSSIAALTGLSRGAVSKLIDRLLAKGLITRTASSLDRRFQEVNLTPSAEKLVPGLAAVADVNDARFFSALSDTERKSLMRLLAKLAAHHQLNTAPTE